jgi:hypothetical protein
MKNIICPDGLMKVTEVSGNVQCFQTETEISKTRSSNDEFYTWQVNVNVTNSVEKSSGEIISCSVGQIVRLNHSSHSA